MATVAEPVYVSVSEAARILRLSEGTIYRRVADGSLHVVRLSEHGAIRIPRKAVEFSASAPRTGRNPAVEPRAHGGDTREAA